MAPSTRPERRRRSVARYWCAGSERAPSASDGRWGGQSIRPPISCSRAARGTRSRRPKRTTGRPLRPPESRNSWARSYAQVRPTLSTTAASSTDSSGGAGDRTAGSAGRRSRRGEQGRSRCGRAMSTIRGRLIENALQDRVRACRGPAPWAVPFSARGARKVHGRRRTGPDQPDRRRPPEGRSAWSRRTKAHLDGLRRKGRTQLLIRRSQVRILPGALRITRSAAWTARGGRPETAVVPSLSHQSVQACPMARGSIRLEVVPVVVEVEVAVPRSRPAGW